MIVNVRLKKIYKKLLKHYGAQNWWPADSGLECAIGAILTQNTSWKNVEKSILNISSAMDITEENLGAISITELSMLIRPSGFHKRKAESIKRLIDYINRSYGGKIENMEHEVPSALRTNLLAISGIGPETADCILLYALNKPVFVIDKYAYRLFYRHGMVEKEMSYTEMKKIFINNLEESPGLFSEFHALIVEVGKNHCRKRANCEGCPLDFDTHHYSNEII